jgi:hypothetical protein
MFTKISWMRISQCSSRQQNRLKSQTRKFSQEMQQFQKGRKFNFLNSKEPIWRCFTTNCPSTFHIVESTTRAVDDVKLEGSAGWKMKAELLPRDTDWRGTTMVSKSEMIVLEFMV